MILSATTVQSGWVPDLLQGKSVWDKCPLKIRVNSRAVIVLAVITVTGPQVFTVVVDVCCEYLELGERQVTGICDSCHSGTHIVS